MRFIIVLFFILVVGIGLAQEPRLDDLIIYPTQVAQGQHILVRGIGTDVNFDDFGSVQISLTFGNEAIPLQRVQLLPPDSTTVLPPDSTTDQDKDIFIFLVPYGVVDGEYLLTVEWNGNSRERTISVSGEIDSAALGWECLHNNFNLERIRFEPTCAAINEDIYHPLDNWGTNWETLRPLLSDSEVATPKELCDSNHLAPLGDWLCNNSEKALAFVAGQDAKPIYDSEGSKILLTIPEGTPGGINEAFILTSQEQARDIINVLTDLVDFNTAVVVFERDITQIGGDLDGLRGAAVRGQFQLLDANYEPLNGTVGLCQGAISTWTVLDTSIGLGRALADLRDNLTSYVQPLLDAVATTEEEVKFIVDPFPNQKGTDYLDQSGVTPDRDYNGISGTGNGVTIAVLDTGVSNVEPFFENIKIEPGEDQDIIGGPEDFNEHSSPDDYYKKDGINIGHGTGIALLAAGQQVGVAREATIYPVRVCDENGWCKGTDIIKGVCKALSNNASDKLVINMSFSGKTPMRALERVIEDATKAGAVVVAAAGNEGRDNCKGICVTTCTGNSCVPPVVSNEVDDDIVGANIPLSPYANKPHYPAAYSPSIDGLIAVGALNSQLKPRWYSNRGFYVDLAAPDYLLLKDVPPFIESHNYNEKPNTSFYKGTSFSTALVSGAAAVLRQIGNVSPGLVEKCLENSSRPLTGLTTSESLAVGSGLLKVGSLVSLYSTNPECLPPGTNRPPDSIDQGPRSDATQAPGTTNDLQTPQPSGTLIVSLNQPQEAPNLSATVISVDQNSSEKPQTVSSSSESLSLPPGRYRVIADSQIISNTPNKPCIAWIQDSGWDAVVTSGQTTSVTVTWAKKSCDSEF